MDATTPEINILMNSLIYSVFSKSKPTFIFLPFTISDLPVVVRGIQGGEQVTFLNAEEISALNRSVGQVDEITRLASIAMPFLGVTVAI